MTTKNRTKRAYFQTQKALPFASFFLGVLLTGCSQPFEVSVHSDSINKESKNYEITVDLASFDGTNDESKKRLEPLNNHLSMLTDSLINSTIADADTFFTTYDKQLKAGEVAYPLPEFKYELYNVDSVFAVSEKIISNLTIAYIFSGGAHGRTEFYATNYSPEKQQFLSNEDILDYSKSAQIDSLLKANFINTDNSFWSEPTLEQVAAINVTSKELRFTYAHYTLGPYSCGAPVVTIPLSSLKGIYRLDNK